MPQIFIFVKNNFVMLNYCLSLHRYFNIYSLKIPEL